LVTKIEMKNVPSAKRVVAGSNGVVGRGEGISDKCTGSECLDVVEV
jgi:hypothetical protein